MYCVPGQRCCCIGMADYPDDKYLAQWFIIRYESISGELVLGQIEGGTRHQDLGQVQVRCPADESIRCALEAWHFTPHCFSRPRSKWVDCEGRFVSRGTELRVRCCNLHGELRRISRWIYRLQLPNDQRRYLSKFAEQSSESAYGFQQWPYL